MKIIIPFLIFASILFLLDFFFYRSLRLALFAYKITVLEKVWIKLIYWILSLSFYFLLFYMFNNRHNVSPLNYHWGYTLFGLLILLYIPKLFTLVFQLSDDLIQICKSLFHKAFKEGTYTADIESRRFFLSQLGLLIAALPFTGILYGILFGKFNYRVEKANITSTKLPAAFDGFKIVQISDAHLGSFSKLHEPVLEALDRINKLNPDLIVFTGDLVNNVAEEATMWIDAFKSLKAKHGKFSILGNHDYGDYIQWNSNTEKTQNLKNLKTIHKEMGFELLNNKGIDLHIGTEKIGLLGVENWGKPPFPQHGDLTLANSMIDENVFKVLLSHDPSHFDLQVKGKTNIDLTLSGHTHGMQFGIEIPKLIKWSPVKYKYPKWAGLYTENKQHLYVNRGFGVLGFPGRVGMPPEITEITLRKA